MIKKIVMMCAAALFACAGAVADDGGSDPGVLSPGEWTTDLTVNGKKVWSKYSQPKGAGWNCVYDSKAKCFKLTLLSPTEYTLGGKLTGRVMDKNSNVTKIEVGMVSIAQSSTVTLDNFSVTGKKDDAAVSIKGGKTVKLVIRGTSTIAETEGSSSIALCMPPKTSVTVSGGKADSLVVAGRVTGAKRAAGGEIALDGPQLSLAADSDLSKLVIVRGGVQARAADAILKLRVENELLVPKGTSLSAGKIVTRKASVDGRLDIIRMSATAAEISTNAEVTVGEYLRAMNLQILGGKVSLPNNTSEIVIVDGAKMEACGGSIVGKGSIHTLNLHGDLGWIYRKDLGEPLIADWLNEDWDSDVLFYWPELEKLNDPVLNVRGGLIDVYEIGRDHNRSRHGNADPRHNMDVYVYVGEVRVVHSEVQQFRQYGGRFFAVDDDNGRPALDCYYSLDICGDGMFYASGVVFEGESTLYPCPQIAGGNVHWPWKSGLVKFPYSQTGCSCVEVSGLPAASKVHVGDLPFEYGVVGRNSQQIWTDDDGKLFLWFPNREEPYQFSVEGKVYEATVHSMATTATPLGPRRYMVVYETVFGTLWDAETGRRAKEATFYLPGGEPIPVFSPDDLKLTYSGRNFKGWTISEENGRKIYPTKDVMPGDTIGPIYCDIRLVDYSREITADDVSKEPEEGAAPVDPAKTGEKIVTVRFYMDPWESNPRDYVERDYIAGTRYGDLPVVTPPEGRVLDFWQRRTGGGFGGEKIDEDSIVRTENHCLYANWKKRPATEWTCQFVTKTGLSDDSDWSVFAKHDFNIASPVAWMPSETPTRPRHRFVRWETYNDRECIMEPVTIDTIVAQRPSWVEAVWERDWFDWTRNRFESKVLSAIVDGFPSDPALVKSVKGQGLAAGLKLVQDKTTKQWCLEGVPTELVDHATRDMFVEVTLKDGTKSTLLVKVRVNPEIPVVMRPAFVNENYGMCEYMHRLDDDGRQLGVAKLTPAEMRHPFVMADEYWPGAAKDWKITGLPAGLKFATKDATAWTDAAGIKQFAPLGSIYGFVKAPCAAIVTASHTVKGVAGGSYTESFKSTIEIHTYETTSDGYWVGGFLTDERIDGYVGEKIVCTFYSGHGLAGNTKFKFTGLPSGLSYTAVEKKVSGYEKPIPAGSIYGTLKKETKAWASGTDGSGRRPLTVIISFTERPPEVSVDAGAGGLLKAALMKFKPTEAAAIAETGTALMQGAAYKYRINCDADAKVKVSGLPAGLKLVQNKDKKSADYGKWTLEGAPSKVGEYVAVITVTLNGVSSSITQRYVVQENAFAGEYRGVIASSPAADAAPRTGTILVNIAAGGATKVTVSEDGKSTLSYSAKSYGYVDSGDYAFVEFELKPSSADKKLGYGKRKGRVTISKPVAEVPDYRILEGVVELEEGTAVGEVEGNFVAPSAVNALGSGIDRESRFFTVSDGGFDVPIATVRHEIKSGQKIPTADIAVTLYDGTTAKIAKQPIVRDAAKPGADEAQRACYSLAPFAVKAKDGQVFVFHGFKYRGYNLVDALEGVVTFVSAGGEVLTVDEADADAHSPAAIELNDYFRNTYKAQTTLMTFDYGWEGFETFALDHVNGGTKRDCLVLDLGGEEIAKIPAKNKIGMDGVFSYKFTTKDKIYTYQLDLVYAQDIRYSPLDGKPYIFDCGRLVGMVTKTWKEGKETKTLHGVVDFTTLDPVE